MEVTWFTFKDFLTTRNVSVQHIIHNNNYHLKAIDGPFSLDCVLPIGVDNADTLDFETNFKPTGNKSPNYSFVTTQFEKDDKTLKLCSALKTIGLDGSATLLFKIPGVPGSNDGRFVAGGMAWFESAMLDDRVFVYVTDEDNLLGQGAGFVLRSYTDEEMPLDQQGWRVPFKRGQVDVEPIGGYGFIPAGFYVKIVGKRANPTGEFICNIFWGKLE